MVYGNVLSDTIRSKFGKSIGFRESEVQFQVRSREVMEALGK